MRRLVSLVNGRKRKSQSLAVYNDSSSSTSFDKVLGLSLDSHDPLNCSVRAERLNQKFEGVARIRCRYVVVTQA